MDERIVSEWRRLDCSGLLSRELSNLRNRLESCETGAYVAFAALSEGVELPEGFNVIAPEIEPWVENVLTDQASGGEAYVDFLCWWKYPEPAVIQAMPGDVDVDKRRRMWARRKDVAGLLLKRVREIEAGLDAIDRQHQEEAKGQPPNVKTLLVNWAEIAKALARTNDAENRSRIRRANESYDGPIKFGGRGCQPCVDRDLLVAWWNELDERWGEFEERDRSKKATVSNRYPHGRNAEVVPDIRGQVRKRRKR